MKEEYLLLLSDIQKLINQVVLIDYTIIILGDDYLQATVWNVFFFENQKDMVDVIDKRKEEIGKTLLDEIIIDLTNHKIAICKDFFEKLRKTYMSIDNKINMRCKYEEFLEYYENLRSIGG